MYTQYIKGVIDFQSIYAFIDLKFVLDHKLEAVKLWRQQAFAQQLHVLSTAIDM